MKFLSLTMFQFFLLAYFWFTSSIWLETMTIDAPLQMFGWLSVLISVTLHSSGNEMKNFAVSEWPTYSVLTPITRLYSIRMTRWFSVDTLDPHLWWWYWNDLLLIQRWSSGPSAETYPSSFIIVNSILILRWFRFQLKYYWMKSFVIVLLEWPSSVVVKLE